MHSVTFEDLFPIVRELGREKARTVMGCCGLTAPDIGDIEGQLLLVFYIRFPKFDERRASIRTFASRVMDNELRSLVRYRRAGRRDHSLECPLIEALTDDGPEDERGGVASPAQRQQFWLDVERALAPLPSVLRETAVALCWNSPSEVSRSSGRSRTTIYARIRHLRDAFTAAGIGPSYFASSGADR